MPTGFGGLLRWALEGARRGHHDHLDDATVRVLAAHGRRVYLVGDSGPHPAFAAFGRHRGALDVVLMPVGAYEPR